MSLVMEQEDTASQRDSQWEAVLSRDATVDGSFVYAVKTTGIYCRPSCPSRAPKRRNVVFYETTAAAEAEGFRACRRCNPAGKSPAETTADVVAQACRRIENAEEMPKLEVLAASAGLSPFHFHRQFKAVTGLTPKAYGAAQRSKRVRAELADGTSSVTSAIYGAGFNSNSRFYETSNQVLGMTPSAYRAGRQGRRDPFRDRRVLARRDPRRARARRASARSRWATTPRRSSATSRTASRTPG